MDNLALGLNAAVIGFFLAVMPFLPRERTWARSLVVFAVLGLWARYLVWRVTATAPMELMSGLGLFFVAGLVIEIMIFVMMVLFFMTLSRTVNRTHEADRYEQWLRSLDPELLPSVDVFLPTYNEGLEIIERGIVAAKALDYPKFKVWVLDDGRRDWLRDLCAAKGVGYIRRPDNKYAKAGNINNALAVTDGELFVIFDADFTPYRNFLYRTVGFFFADPRIAIVQTPQHFFNPDVFHINLGLSGVMQDNEREWYDEILTSRDAWDCAFCCGTSAIFRRDAIQIIDGIATESITEDILTTLKLLRHGYITRYLNERLSIGMAPLDMKSLLIQRQRWARGHIQVLHLMLKQYGSGLTLRQWLFFLPFHYFVDFPSRLLFALLPVIGLWTGISHFYVNSTAELLAYQGPMIIASLLLSRWLIPHARMPLLSTAISSYLSGRVFPTILTSLIKPFGVPFRVTPKGKINISESGDLVAVWWTAALIVFTVSGIIVSCHSPERFYSSTGLLIVTFWALCNLVVFTLILLCVLQRPRLRGEERFPIGRPGSLMARGQKRICSVVNLSLTGALLDNADDLEIGESVSFSLNGAGEFTGKVVRKLGNKAGIRLNDVTEADRDRLIVYLYTSGFSNEVREPKPFHVLWQLLKEAIAGAEMSYGTPKPGPR
jgi:cellulose synthase (UDP-forming)